MMKLMFLGPPGAGKGTQAAMVSARYGVPHISTGDIFRKNIREKTALGQKAQSYIERGELVPDALTVDLVRDRLGEADCAKGFLLDGFPRTVAQAEALATFVALDCVVNIEVEEEHLIHRLSGRRVCASCAGTLRVDTLGGATKCPTCGGDLIQRKDDEPETVANRLRVYEKQTQPLIAYYRETGLLHSVDGAIGQEDVFCAICRVLDAL